MEQTAVEYLVKELNQKIDFIPLNIWDDIANLVSQAKEMEKKQIIEARVTAPLLSTFDKSDYKDEAEQYYIETFGKD